MFYVLNFADHSFQTCAGTVEAVVAIQVLLQTGIDMSNLEIVNGFIDESRMSVPEFIVRFWEE